MPRQTNKFAPPIAIAIFFALQWTFPPSSLAQRNEVSAELNAARVAVSKAYREYSDAKTAVSQATVAKMRLEKLVEVEYRSRPDLLELKQYAKDVARHLNTLRAAVQWELDRDPALQSLKERERTAVHAFRAAQADANGTATLRKEASDGLLAARQSITRYEAAAFALDPAIDDARVELNFVNDEIRQLEARYRKLALTDERLVAASAEIDHARQRSDSARAALNDAQVQLAEAERRESLRTTRGGTPPPIHRPDE